jgi:hypothetical protein
MTDAAISTDPSADPGPLPEAAAPDAVSPEVAASVETPDPVALIDRVMPEIDPAAGALRRLILEHLADSVEAGPQSVSQIIAALPANITRNTAESAIRRAYTAGEIERVDRGLYVLAPPKPAEPPKPAPRPPDEAALFEALDRWAIDPTSWNIEEFGPPPDDPASQISLDIRTRFFDRVRKREARRRDAEAAAARQAAADRELRDQLLAVTNGNFVAGPAIDDVAPIRAAMELVPLDRIILTAIQGKVDPRLSLPSPGPLLTWRNPELLRRIAELYCRFILVPSMVDAWSKAGKAPGKPADASEASPAVPQCQ